MRRFRPDSGRNNARTQIDERLLVAERDGRRHSSRASSRHIARQQRYQGNARPHGILPHRTEEDHHLAHERSKRRRPTDGEDPKGQQGGACGQTAAGILYLAGMLIMAYNTWKTIAGRKAVDAAIPVAAAAQA